MSSFKKTLTTTIKRKKLECMQMKDYKNKPIHTFTRHQEIQIWCLIAAGIILALEAWLQ